MKIQNSAFEGSAVEQSQYPTAFMPEIAFAGRSNVGKSSLINLLLNRKKIAKTSSTPGKTQTINFYRVNDCFRFVDLPGYGYARVSKSKQEHWAKSIEEYLVKREMLLEIYILQDCRRRPRELDIQMIRFVTSLGYKANIILTKVDKLSMNERNKAINSYAQDLGIAKTQIYETSAQKRIGREDLLDSIECALVQRGGIDDYD